MNSITSTLSLLLFSSFANAALDQISNAIPSQSDVTTFAQTFVPSTDGNLIGIWLYLDSDYAFESNDKYWVTINRFENGSLAEELARGSFVEGEIPEDPSWYYIAFELPYSQEPGELLAISVTGGYPFGLEGGWVNFGVFGVGIDTYLPGNAYVYVLDEWRFYNSKSNIDFIFATVVDEYQEPPEEFINPSYVRVAVRNRFDARNAAILKAHNLTSGEVVNFYSGFSPTVVTGDPGEEWEFAVDLDGELNPNTQLTLRKIGYTGTQSIRQVMPDEGKTDITVYYWNDSPRVLPEWDYNIWWHRDPPILWSISCYDPQPETRYIFEYTRDMVNWYKADETEVHRFQQIIALQADYPYNLTVSGTYWRIRVESPENH
jgi:hypothetical protein